jgi:lipopolysaccharide transport system permease protein
VFLINAVWVKLFLGVICTRFRDLTHLVNTVMRVMFFLTPIIWLPEQLGERVMQFLWWNPFAHFIWIFRTPILDGDPAVESWIYVGVVTVVGWVLALTAFSLFRKRIVFWL